MGAAQRRGGRDGDGIGVNVRHGGERERHGIGSVNQGQVEIRRADGTNAGRGGDADERALVADDGGRTRRADDRGRHCRSEVQANIFIHYVRDDGVAAGIGRDGSQPERHGVEGVRDAGRAAGQFEEDVIRVGGQGRANQIDVDGHAAAIQHAARAAQNNLIIRAGGAGVQIEIRFGADGVGEVARNGVGHARRAGASVRAAGHGDVADHRAAAAQGLRAGQRECAAAGQRGHGQRAEHGVAGSIGGRGCERERASADRGGTAVAQRAAERLRSRIGFDEAQRAAARAIRQRAGE